MNDSQKINEFQRWQQEKAEKSRNGVSEFDKGVYEATGKKVSLSDPKLHKWLRTRKEKGLSTNYKASDDAYNSLKETFN